MHECVPSHDAICVQACARARSGDRHLGQLGHTDTDRPTAEHSDPRSQSLTAHNLTEPSVTTTPTPFPANMTGGGAFVTAPREEYDLGNTDHSVQWVGTPGVKGPPWARLPLLTVGMLGTQVVWSVEMGYGAFCYDAAGIADNQPLRTCLSLASASRGCLSSSSPVLCRGSSSNPSSELTPIGVVPDLVGAAPSCSQEPASHVSE